MEKDIQIIYVLTNSSMPGLVKIGKTSRSDVESRMRELYSTGVPVPFECYYACQVEKAPKVEKSLHLAFGDLRVNPNREFFKLSPDKVLKIKNNPDFNIRRNLLLKFIHRVGIGVESIKIC